MKVNIKWYLILVIVFYSCSISKNVEKRIEDCVIENYNSNLLNFYDIEDGDFYKDILIVEDVFIQNKVIINNTQQNYFELIKNIDGINKNQAITIINKINDRFEKKGIPKYQDNILTSGIFSCPLKFFNDKNRANKYPIGIIGIGFNSLEYDNFQSQELLNYMFSVIEEKDFNKLVYRSYYIIAIYLNLLEKSGVDK